MVNIKSTSLVYHPAFTNDDDESILKEFRDEELSILNMLTYTPCSSTPVGSFIQSHRISNASTNTISAETSEMSTQTFPTRTTDVVSQTPTHWDLAPTLKIKVKSQNDTITDLRKQICDLKTVHANFTQLSTSFKELSERNEHLEVQITSLRSELEEKHNVFCQPIHCSSQITGLNDNAYRSISTSNQFRGLTDEHDFTSSPSEPSISDSNNDPKVGITRNTTYNVQRNDTDTVNTKNLIVGDSMLKHIRTRGLSDTSVRTKRGSTVSQLCNTLQDMNLENVSNVIIHAGTNDCSQNDFSVSSLRKHFHELTTHLQQRISGNVFVSGICPRLDNTNFNKRIAEANDMLKTVFGQSYIDHTKYFTNAYGINSECFVNHGLHLNKKGTSVLLKSINRIVQQVIRTTPRQQIPESRQPYSTVPCFNQEVVTTPCFNCGETGHVQRVCRHGAPVTCWKCNSIGHKAKFCQAYYDY